MFIWKVCEVLQIEIYEYFHIVKNDTLFDHSTPVAS